jgi:hypothetical protein
VLVGVGVVGATVGVVGATVGVVATGGCVLGGNGNGEAVAFCTGATAVWTGAVAIGEVGTGVPRATARPGWYADSKSANATPATTANRSRTMVANRNRGNASPPKEARVAHPVKWRYPRGDGLNLDFRQANAFLDAPAAPTVTKRTV